jgi:hypothetical protein
VGFDRFLVFSGEIRSTLGVLWRDLIGLGVLLWVPISYWYFLARFDPPWRFAASLLQFSVKFSIGIEVFGEFSIGVGLLWDFSLFMFGLAHFLHVF